MTARSTVSHRRMMLSALAAAAVVVLTGCGALHPGVAADVGSVTIPRDEVDDIANVLCSAKLSGAEAQGETASELATRLERETALEVLLESELSRQFGEEMGVEADEEQVAQAVAENEASIEQLPEHQRDVFRNTVRKFFGGQLILVEIGRASLADQGQSEAPDDQAIAEGQRLRAAFVEKIEVEVDPRYGTFTDGAFAAGGAALSVPASDHGLAGAKANPGSQFIAGLPASQRCN